MPVAGWEPCAGRGLDAVGRVRSGPRHRNVSSDVVALREPFAVCELQQPRTDRVSRSLELRGPGRHYGRQHDILARGTAWAERLARGVLVRVVRRGARGCR